MYKISKKVYGAYKNQTYSTSHLLFIVSIMISLNDYVVQTKLYVCYYFSSLHEQKMMLILFISWETQSH